MSPEHNLKLALAESKLKLALPIEILATISLIKIVVADIQREVYHFNLSIRLDEVDSTLRIRD